MLDKPVLFAKNDRQSKAAITLLRACSFPFMLDEQSSALYKTPALVYGGNVIEGVADISKAVAMFNAGHNISEIFSLSSTLKGASGSTRSSKFTFAVAGYLISVAFCYVIFVLYGLNNIWGTLLALFPVILVYAPVWGPPLNKLLKELGDRVNKTSN